LQLDVTNGERPLLNDSGPATKSLDSESDLTIIIVSGYTAQSNLPGRVARPSVRFLAKRFEARTHKPLFSGVTAD
jgi:hypothetical protein